MDIAEISITIVESCHDLSAIQLKYRCNYKNCCIIHNARKFSSPPLHRYVITNRTGQHSRKPSRRVNNLPINLFNIGQPLYIFFEILTIGEKIKSQLHPLINVILSVN